MYKHARIVAVVMTLMMLSSDALAGRFFSGRFRGRLRGRFSRRVQVVVADQSAPLIVPTAPSITTALGSVDILPRSVVNLPGINPGVSTQFLVPPGASVNPVTPMPMRVITPRAPQVVNTRDVEKPKPVTVRPVPAEKAPRPKTGGAFGDFSDLTPPES